MPDQPATAVLRVRLVIQLTQRRSVGQVVQHSDSACSVVLRISGGVTSYSYARARHTQRRQQQRKLCRGRVAWCKMSCCRSGSMDVIERIRL